MKMAKLRSDSSKMHPKFLILGIPTRSCAQRMSIGWKFDYSSKYLNVIRMIEKFAE